ncbi:MAG TPA: hypothetical protein VG015_06795, partial [Candidatus Dormibacteraeota bacterium]|nr:hypothetical protein [Candidatus Dormibacteraeota bacterium]
TAQADQDILGTLRQSSLGTTSLAAVTEVDIFKVDYDSSSGNLTPDPVDVNRYTLAGACLNCTPNPPWPASTRQVGGSPDFLGVTIKYGYTWKSGVLLAAHPLALQETYWMRLEPQSY